MKRVVVSQRVDLYPKRAETRDALDQRLVDFIGAANGLAMPVPNVIVGRGLDDWLGSIQPEGVVLSGGNDIGESQRRDATERCLIEYALNRGIPILGICRGMQMLACWAGAPLRPVSGHVRSRHQIRGEINADVNSYHRYSLSSCPKGFVVTGQSDDGEIESIRHEALRWEGWMWHPEREPEFSAQDIERLEKLLA